MGVYLFDDLSQARQLAQKQGTVVLICEFSSTTFFVPKTKDEETQLLADGFYEPGNEPKNNVLKTHISHAYSPREVAVSQGKCHIVVDQDIKIGRLARKKSDALCKPRAKFWGLERIEWIATCPKCIELAEKYNIPFDKELPE